MASTGLVLAWQSSVFQQVGGPWMALKYWVLHQNGEEKRTLSPAGQR